MPSDVDQEYSGRLQQANDVEDGRALLAAHPELLKMVRPDLAEPSSGPKSPAEAGAQQKAVEGTDQGLSRPVDTALQAGALVAGTLMAPGANLATKAAVMGASLYSASQGQRHAQDAVRALFPGHPNVEAAAGLVGGLFAGGGAVRGAGAPAAANESASGILGADGKPAVAEAPSATEAGPSVPEGMVRFYHGGDSSGGGPRWLTPDQRYAEGYAAKSGAPVSYVDIPEDSPLLHKAFDDEGTGTKAPYISFEAPENIAKDLRPIAPPAAPSATDVTRETPEQSAWKALAQKQLDALKTVKVGEGGAAEFGRPDIATTISNEETMAQAKALRMSVEGVFSKEVEPPTQSAENAALSGVFKGEAADIVDTASQFGGRMAAGEAISPEEMQAYNARLGTFGVQYAKLAGNRSEAGRSLQILDPLKPDNVQSTRVAQLVQQLALPENAGKSVQLGMALTPERMAQATRQMAEDVGLGRNLYDAFNEYWVNNLLSNAGRTSGRIGTSNAMSALLTLPERQVAAMIPGTGVKMMEPAMGVRAFFDGWWHNLDVGLESAKTMQPLSQIEGGSVDTAGWTPKQAISAEAFGLEDASGFKGGVGTALDFAGSVLRLGNRAIMGVHQFGHAASKSISGGMLAWRDAVDQAAEEGLSGMAGFKRANAIYTATLNDMPAEMRLAASKEADITTFVNQMEKPAQGANPSIGDVPYYLQQITRAPGIHQLMPFFRIGYNVTKAGADLTPGVGQATLLPELINGTPAQRGVAVGKMALGAVMCAAVVHEFHEGNLILDDYGKPYAKVGYYKIAFQPPLDFPIAACGNFIANMHKQDDPGVLSTLSSAVKAMGTATADNTIVQGMVNLKRLWVDLAGGDPHALQKYVGELLTPVIPFSSLVGSIARGTDSTKRSPETVGQELESNIPVLREQVPKNYDIFNKESPAATLGLPDALIFPVSVQDVDNDPVKKMIADTGAKFQHIPDVIYGRKPRPGESPDAPDVGVPLDSGDHYGPDHQAWNKARAAGLYQELDAYRRGAFKTDSPMLRTQRIETIGHDHADLARVTMLSNPRIAKLYNRRMQNKAAIYTPADLAAAPPETP